VTFTEPYIRPPQHEEVFRIHGLGKAFGSTVLLADANLAVHRGETLAIIGESGSGKSVLLKMLMGLIEPDAGSILFKGQDVVKMLTPELAGLRQQVGYVFQNDALFDSMTILDNIGYAMREHSRSTDEEVRTRALECLELVGLETRVLDLYPANLSGGMRKRVGIARAIAIKPEVLLYDEPTQGLDPQSITRIGMLIEGLKRELRATSVIVTHDMRTAFGVCTRIALLHEGRFDHMGTPVDLVHRPSDPVREFIADAYDELRDLPFLQRPA
jgi:phospholipid/cholesterol/gamma-HCH transport system ATP-binding protein